MMSAVLSTDQSVAFRMALFIVSVCSMLTRDDLQEKLTKTSTRTYTHTLSHTHTNTYASEGRFAHEIHTLGLRRRLNIKHISTKCNARSKYTHTHTHTVYTFASQELHWSSGYTHVHCHHMTTVSMTY